MPKPTHYEVLGVSPAASQEEIKKRYRDLARRLHPDVAGMSADEEFRSINEAYRILSDSESRMFYDAELKLAARKAENQRPQQRPAPAAPTPQPSAEPPTGQRGGSWQSSGKSTKTGKDSSGERRSPVEVYLSQARSAARRLRYREAESLCRQALRLDRRNTAAYEILGDIHRARGNHDEAVAMYSYALQLDRNNAALREKFDKLVGQPTGPTMAGRAAASQRSRRASRATQSPVDRKIGATRTAVNSIGFFLVACMLAFVATSEVKLARSPFFIEWDPVLLLGLAASGWMGGFVLAVNRRIGRFFDELTGIHEGARAALGVPTAAITMVFSVISLYAGFVTYAILGVLQRYHSTSVLTAFGFSAAIAVFFTMVAQGAGIYVMISGGSVVFLTFLVGWSVGDIFR